MKEEQIVLEECLVCKSSVLEIGHNEYACNKCKSVWKYNGQSWINQNDQKQDLLNFLPESNQSNYDL